MCYFIVRVGKIPATTHTKTERPIPKRLTKIYVNTKNILKISQYGLLGHLLTELPHSQYHNGKK